MLGVLKTRHALVLFLVMLANLAAPLAAWSESQKGLSCCCSLPADEDLGIVAIPFDVSSALQAEQTSCCPSTNESARKNKAANAQGTVEVPFSAPLQAPDRTCLCSPAPIHPPQERIETRLSERSLDFRRVRLVMGLVVDAVVSATQRKRPRFVDPHLAWVKNGVRGRLALLSVDRN